MKWHTPKKTSKLCRCPCCDYVTLPERGSYLICPVCYWEDEGLDIDHLDIESGANHGITLRKGRLNFLEFGACEPEMISNVVSVQERESYGYKPRTL